MVSPSPQNTLVIYCGLVCPFRNQDCGGSIFGGIRNGWNFLLLLKYFNGDQSPKFSLAFYSSSYALCLGDLAWSHSIAISISNPSSSVTSCSYVCKWIVRLLEI